MGKIKKLAKKIGRGIKKIGKKIGKAFKGVFGGITNKLGPLGTMALMMFMGPAGQAFSTWGGEAATGFGNFVKFTGDAMNWVAKAPGRTWDSITDMVSSAWNGMTTKFGRDGSYWDSISGDYTGKYDEQGFLIDEESYKSPYEFEAEDAGLVKDETTGKWIEEKGVLAKAKDFFTGKGDLAKRIKEKPILGTKTTVGDAMWGTSAAFKGYGIYNAFNPTDADLGSGWWNRNLDDANNMLSLASDQGSRTLPTTPISLDFAQPLNNQIDFYKDRFITANGFLPSLQLRNSINDITPYGTNFDEYFISNIG